MRLLEHKDFDLSDFARRWRLARISALRAGANESGTSDPVRADLEIELIEQAGQSDETAREAVLRRLFDNSRKLGQSLVRSTRLSWELSDITDVLPAMGSPCFQGSWREHNGARVLNRTGCSDLARAGKFACDYWREALDGLVMGVGDVERFARHRSKGHGDDECLDVLFEDALPAAGETMTGPSRQRGLRWGDVPAEFLSALAPFASRLAEKGMRLSFDGLSEGVVYYRIESDGQPLCGAGGKLIHDSLKREAEKSFGMISLQDASPLAVYGGAN